MPVSSDSSRALTLTEPQVLGVALTGGMTVRLAVGGRMEPSDCGGCVVPRGIALGCGLLARATTASAGASVVDDERSVRELVS